MKKHIFYLSLFFIFSFFLKANLLAEEVYIINQADSKVLIWDYNNDTVEEIGFPELNPIKRIIVTKQGDFLYYSVGGNLQCDFVAYNLKKKKEEARIDLYSLGIGRVSCMNIDFPKHVLWLTAGQSPPYIAIIDLKDISLKKVISPDDIPQFVEFSIDNKKAYVSMFTNRVEVYSTTNYEHLKSIETGNYPNEYMSDIVRGIGQSLIVANRCTGMLYMIDTKKDEVILAKYSGLITPDFLAVDKKRSRLYGTDEKQEILGVYDLRTLDFLASIQVPYSYYYLEMIEIYPPYKYLIHSCKNPINYEGKIEIINLETFLIEKELPLGIMPGRSMPYISIKFR